MNFPKDVVAINATEATASSGCRRDGINGRRIICVCLCWRMKYVSSGRGSYRMLCSHPENFIHLLRSGDIPSLKGLSQLDVIVLNSGSIIRTMVLTSHMLCRKKVISD